MKNLIFALIVFPILTSFLFSQTNSNNSIGFVLPGLRIESRQASYIVTADFENEYNLFSISNDTLYGDKLKNNYKSALDDIKSVAVVKGSEAGRGALFGAAFFFIGGFLWGAIQQSNTLSEGDHDFGACLVRGLFIGAAFTYPGALIGSLLGFLTPHYEEIDLAKSHFLNKKEKLIKSLTEFGYKYDRKEDK